MEVNLSALLNGSGLPSDSHAEPSTDGSELIGIDLFCGAGGMTLGARQAGINVIFAVELCPYAAATYRRNFPDTALHVGDIRSVVSLPLRPNWVQTVVFGGPPCQGFSTSNQRTRTARNPVNWMYKELIRVAKIWHPDWIVIENVRGIRETLKGFFLEAIIKELKSVGYNATPTTLNAVDYGVPQRRERTFVIASRDGRKIKDPVKLNSSPVTVGESIHDLPSLAPGASIDELPYPMPPKNSFVRGLRSGLVTVTANLVTMNAPHVLERYRHVPQGGNWEDIPPRLMANYADRSKCHTGIYRRLDSRKPSVVIGNFRKNMLIHPEQDRGLSVREAARIQSVPDSFRFCGSIGFQQQQVGNLVPPPLARAIFRELAPA